MRRILSHIVMHGLLTLAGLAAPAAVTPAAAAARDYRIDPVHTRLLFRIDHAGLSTAMGSFSGITGSLRFDPDDPAATRVEVRIPIDRLDLGDPEWNHTMSGRGWFDAERHPQARYVADRVEVLDDGRWRIHGQLTLRGQQREVALDARINAHKRHPLTLRRTLGVSATATLRRSDFGMQRWPNLVGDEVALLIELEAQRGRPRDRKSDDRDTTTGEDDHADPQ
ncbi:MAG TPA: YceI family protein [Arenimonas sp.]|nr:YceI family protein [Arenimonas sp.]